MNPNTEVNIKEKLELLKDLHTDIQVQRKELNKEFHRITCTGKPFGLEALKRMERDGKFDHNIAHLARYTEENKDKLKKDKPDLFKQLNGIVDYMKEGDYEKKYGDSEGKVNIGKVDIGLDKELSRMKALTKDRKAKASLKEQEQERSMEDIRKTMKLESKYLPQAQLDTLNE